MKKKLIILIGVFFIGIVIYLLPYYIFVSKTLRISLIKTLLSQDGLKKYQDQVNILVLGISGGNRPGDDPNISDSIIIFNYNFDTNQITSISVPRDIWSNTLQDKINSAYSGGGLSLAKTELEKVTGLPIQYAAVIDFAKFKNLIDNIGGIDVYVENSFTDNLYPLAGRENDTCDGDPQFACRYETISFLKGQTHMNGETALKFVRSRHADGEEGSDFARENRQQKVIDGIKNKMLTLMKQGNANDLASLYNSIDQIIKRDITNQQAAILAKNIFFKGNLHQNSVVLTEDFFTVPDYTAAYNGLWVLLPKDNNFATVQNYIKCNLRAENCEYLKPSPTPIL